MSTLTVSCVIPAFNARVHLEAAVSSVLGQTRPVLEIVVVDDASSDDTVEVARQLGDPVRVVTLPENRGAPAARAAGLASARGELVSFLDADDLWAPDKLERQVLHLEGPPELDASFAEIENFWEPGFEAEAERWRHHGRIRSAFHFGTLLARRSLFDRVPIPTARRHTDVMDWVVRARETNARIATLDRVLAHRRRHATNVTRTSIATIHDEYFDLLKERLDRARAGGA